MLVSALSIITGAMRLVNALPSGEAPDGTETTDALEILNQLMDALSNKRLIQPSLPQLAVTWPADTRELTMGVTGSGADIEVAQLPVKFWSGSFVWSSNMIPPLEIIDQEQWNSIVFTNWKGPYPTFLYYKRSSDMDNTATVGIWPLPARETQVFIRYQRETVSFALPSSEYDLLPGYTKYLKYTMAVEMANEWTGRDAPLTTQSIAKQMARDIGVINEQKSHVVSGLTAVAPTYRRGYNGGWPQILTGNLTGYGGGY